MSDFLANILGTGAPTRKVESNTNTGDQNNQQNNSSNNQGDQENNLAPPKSVWDTKTSDTPNGQQKQTIVVKNEPDPVSPDDAMAAHIKGLDLTAGIDVAKLTEELVAGNSDSLASTLEQVAANTYKATMTKMNDIVDSKIAKSQKAAVTSATANVNEQMAIKEMETAMPFTSDPDTAPVAQAVLKKMLKDGMSLVQANEAVGKFFQKTAAAVNKSKQAPDNIPGEGNFNNNSNTNNDQRPAPRGHDDWLADLSG